MIEITIDPPTALCVIAQIQLAIRHPENRGPSKGIAETFARKLQTALSRDHPELATVMELGWDPDAPGLIL